MIWLLYRTFFTMPEWFDEVIAKAAVFGLPALLYARSIKNGSEKLGLSSKRFWSGMYMGLFVGGVYGFVGVLRALTSGVHVEPALLFTSSGFWYQFFLATMTAWWESLFFFGFLMNAVQEEYRLPEAVAVVAATILFIVFHAPLRIMLEGASTLAASQLALLGIFAAGQAILFLRTKSIFSVTLSHALWGMVLVIYGSR